jgi:signal transduction histidine kinase
VADLTENRGIATTVRLSGPLGAIGAEIAEHAEAVTTEAISNTVRHSGATLLTVEVTVADEFAIEITDNGRGIPADNQRRSGLANLQWRAEQVRGSCQVTSAPEGGTTVRWTAPLPDV